MDKNAFEAQQIFSECNKTVPAETLPVLEIPVEKEIILRGDAPVILVIDDSKDIRDYVSSIFENTFAVHTACNGKEAFTIAIEVIPDIVISDVMMPEEDGFYIYKAPKRAPAYFAHPSYFAYCQNTSYLKTGGYGA